MKNIIEAIRKECRSELDKFNKLPAHDRAGYIIVMILSVMYVMSDWFYEFGEYIGSKIGSMIV